MKEAAVA